MENNIVAIDSKNAAKSLLKEHGVGDYEFMFVDPKTSKPMSQSVISFKKGGRIKIIQFPAKQLHRKDFKIKSVKKGGYFLLKNNIGAFRSINPFYRGLYPRPFVLIRSPKFNNKQKSDSKSTCEIEKKEIEIKKNGIKNNVYDKVKKVIEAYFKNKKSKFMTANILSDKIEITYAKIQDDVDDVVKDVIVKEINSALK